MNGLRLWAKGVDYGIYVRLLRSVHEVDALIGRPFGEPFFFSASLVDERGQPLRKTSAGFPDIVELKYGFIKLGYGSTSESRDLHTACGAYHTKVSTGVQE